MTKSIVCCGLACIDTVATVDEFPAPDSKIRATSTNLFGGGNASNVAVALSRLKVNAILITKLGMDNAGSIILQKLADEGVDTSSVVLGGPTSISSSSYIIVEQKRNTRTVIHSPGAELSIEEVDATIASKADILFFDGRHTTAANHIARGCSDCVSIFVELERLRPGLMDLASAAHYVSTSSNFPEEFHRSLNDPRNDSAMLDLMNACSNAKWVVTTRGKLGSFLVERVEQHQVDAQLPKFESIESAIDSLSIIEHSIFETKLAFVDCSSGGRFVVHFIPSYPLQQGEVVDTTGAGDSFNAALLFSIVNGFSTSKSLKFASYYSAMKCKRFGCRDGLLRMDDIDLESFAD